MIIGKDLLVVGFQAFKKFIGLCIVGIMHRAFLWPALLVKAGIAVALHRPVGVVNINGCPAQNKSSFPHRRSHDPEVPAMRAATLCQFAAMVHDRNDDIAVN